MKIFQIYRQNIFQIPGSVQSLLASSVSKLEICINSLANNLISHPLPRSSESIEGVNFLLTANSSFEKELWSSQHFPDFFLPVISRDRA